MMDAIKNVIAFHDHLWTQPGWLILYVLSVVMIIALGKKRLSDRVLAGFVLISGVIAYFPITLLLMVPGMIPSINEYARMGWLMLPVPVVAYAIARIAEKTEQDNKTLLSSMIVIIVVVFVLVNGNLTSHDAFYKMPENSYKLHEEVIEAADVIEDDAVEKGMLTDLDENVLMITDKAKEGQQVEVAVHGYTNDFKYDNYNDYAKMYYGLRQYTPRCVLTSFVMPEDDISKDPAGFTAAIPNYCDYAVVIDSKQAKNAMKNSGFMLLEDTGKFLVYARK